MPAEGLEWLGREEILSFEEIARLVRVLASMGVDEVRLTGGEPLVRRDLPVLVSFLSETPGVRDLSLTTNGVLLDRFAGPLVEAGLTRLNVSLDSLSHVRFAEITRRDALDRVLAASPRKRCPHSPSSPAASRTSSGSSSSCPSTRTRHGARTRC
jgi:cyclic pyranopterin phosphate synthase